MSDLDPGVAADLDGDGTDDIAVQLQTDGTYLVTADIDDDGTLDQAVLDREQLDEALPGAADAIDALVVPDAPVVLDGSLVGDPIGDAEHWFQQAKNGFCAPASVAQIVSEYTGVHFADESEFVRMASEQGLFSVDMDGVPGMTPENTLALLESAGVPAELQFGTTADLARYLGEGRSILLFLDSGEVWEGEAVEDNQYDHAVVLTGIDTERGVAILSDPGSPDGNLEEVPLDVFEDAWADSQNTMIVGDAPPESVPGSPSADTVAAAGDDAPTPIERATSAVVRGPWALLPVTLSRP